VLIPSNVFVINLDERPERLQGFLERANRAGISASRWKAVSGEIVPCPSNWKAGNGAWGCYRSHMQIVEHCLSNRIGSCLIFEDDAVFSEEFADQTVRFFEGLPDDWHQAYLGGQLLHTKSRPPLRINDAVLRPFNVNRTHCYALSRRGMVEFYKHCSKLPFRPREHIDHHLGRWHEDARTKVYCPEKWIVGQHGSPSSVSGKTEPIQFYDNPVSFVLDHWLYRESFCVLFKCSDSLIEGCLDVLHFGNSIENNGFDVSLEEASNLNNPYPKISEWYNWIRTECVSANRIPAAFHPFLTEEMLKDAGVKDVLTVEHESTELEIKAAVGDYLNSRKKNA